jgi:linoleoyl-CoA desaturase
MPPLRKSPKFTRGAGFHEELKRRVERYFRDNNLSPHAGARMYLKTAAILAWFLVSYLLLVFVATSVWQGVLMSLSLALAIAGVGFSIQHDANHGAYSTRRSVNRIMGMTLDMLGASSYVWHWKHNVFHHTYTNLSGSDADIDIAPLARFAPAQPRYRIHRLQQFYMWGLYGFLLPKWHFIDDWKEIACARIASNKLPRPRGFSLVKLIGGKLVFFSWTLVLPLLVHKWWVVLLFYLCTWFLVGIVLGVVFQLAHCADEAHFPSQPGEWAAHQVQTTVDFARKSRLLTWYVGGLNFQIEHHLFPRICHVHYPRIAEIVEAVCAEFGIRYTAHDSLLDAVTSHWRFLRRMGLPIAA